MNTETRWARGITCDAPMREVLKSPSFEVLPPADRSFYSVSSPAPPNRREEPLSPFARCRANTINICDAPSQASSSRKKSIEQATASSPLNVLLNTAAASSTEDERNTGRQQRPRGQETPSNQRLGQGDRSSEARKLGLKRERRPTSMRDMPDIGTVESGTGSVWCDSSGNQIQPWPRDVTELLERCPSLHQLRQRSFSRPVFFEPVTTGLKLLAAGFSIPHPEKLNSKGADSFFIGCEGNCIGIADGVGEWEWRFNVNARAFADELMSGCEAHFSCSYGSMLEPCELALEALQQGYRSTRSFGSSTALVAFLSDSGQLGIANIGDSSLVLLRRREIDSTTGMRCAARTSEQQHAFNCPFQLTLLPTESDFPQLLQDGKHKLVRAIQRMTGASKTDSPEDADLYNFAVQEGDLVILGTDGVFDNLYINDICQLAGTAIGPLDQLDSSLTNPTRLAQAIAKAASYRSMDRSIRSPFGDHAKQAGLYHTGGKMDDITCVCAWLVKG